MRFELEKLTEELFFAKDSKTGMTANFDRGFSRGNISYHNFDHPIGKSPTKEEIERVRNECDILHAWVFSLGEKLNEIRAGGKLGEDTNLFY